MSPLTHELVSAKSKGKPIDKIKKLNCWASNITDISLLKEIPNLEVLTLSVNKIPTLRDIQHCTQLRELYIRDNRISNIDEIFYLKKLNNLKILWLADNECSKDHLYDSEYRLTVIRNLPNLQKLDNSNVTEDEIERAMKLGKLVESAPIDDTQSSEFTDVTNNYEYIMPVKVEEVLVAERKSTSSSFDRKLQEVSQICDEEDEYEEGLEEEEEDDDDAKEPSSTGEEISNRTIDIEVHQEMDGQKTKAESSGSNYSLNNQFGTQSQSCNTVQAVLLLINDLNEMQLQMVMDACETRKLNIRDPMTE